MPETPIKPPPAVLLAAGRGNRLLPLTKDRPKCLLEVGGDPILIHQIRSLRAADVPHIEIVTGHGDALVRKLCASLDGAAVMFAHNAAYATTSSLDSLGCANTDPSDRGLLILNTDVLFAPRLLDRLLQDPREQVLLTDMACGLGEEEMKICTDADDRITAIGKTLDPLVAQGENLGVLKVGPHAAGRMLEIARMPDVSRDLKWVPDAIGLLLDEMPFYTLSTGDIPWIEIDYRHDLKRAREEIWPRIEKEEAAH